MSDFFVNLFSGNIELILKTRGMFVLFLMVFFENGIIIGIIFPGDVLLFTAGVLAVPSANIFSINIYLLVLGLIFFSVLGNVVGFFTGKLLKKRIKSRGRFFILKQDHLDKVQEFYDKYGFKSFFFAKFFPIIRTVLPMIGGTIKVPFKMFLFYNFIGSVVWVGIFVFIGYFLGKKFYYLLDYVDYLVVALTVISNITLIYKWIKYKIKEKIMKRIKNFKKYFSNNIYKLIHSNNKKTTYLTNKILNKQKITFRLIQTLKKKNNE